MLVSPEFNSKLKFQIQPDARSVPGKVPDEPHELPVKIFDTSDGAIISAS
jgi:hypothetical protein